MATIPEYFTQQGIATTNRPRAPQSIAGTGSSVITEAIAGAVQEVGQVVTEAATIEAQKQSVRDSITLSELKGQLYDFEFESAPDPSKVQLIGDFKKLEDEYHKLWDREIETLAHGHTRDVQEAFRVYANTHKINAKKGYRDKSRPMEKQWVMEDLQRQWAKLLKANVGRPKIAKMEIEHLINSYSGYLTPSEYRSMMADVDKSIAALEKMMYLEAVAATTRRLPPKDAKDYINKISRTKITEPERNSLLAQINNQAVQQDKASKEASSNAVRASYQSIVSSKGTVSLSEITRMILADETMSSDDAIAAADKIKSFHSTYNSAIKEADGEDIVTKLSSRVKVNRLVSAVRSGRMTEDQGIETYKVIAKVEKINGKDGEGFIDKISAAGKTSRETEAKRRESMFSRREKQLRDAIQTQYSLFPPEDIDEILEDLANEATIQFRDKFEETDYTETPLAEFKKQVDDNVDDLMRKYSLSETQQLRVVSARQLELAASYKKQQDAIAKMITSLSAEGKKEEAKRMMEEAIRLGLLDAKGERGDIEKQKDKKGVSSELIKRLLEQFK